MVWHAEAPLFVDGLGVLQALAQQAPELAGVKVFTRNPDYQQTQLPYLLITRVGGDSLRPEFQSSYFVHFQVWSDVTVKYPDDAFQAAFELSQDVARVYYRAWKKQILAYDSDDNIMGWIADWRESSGFQEIPDPDLPNVGRYVGVYDLVIRNRRPSPA